MLGSTASGEGMQAVNELLKLTYKQQSTPPNFIKISCRRFIGTLDTIYTKTVGVVNTAIFSLCTYIK